MSISDRWHTRKPRIVNGLPVELCRQHDLYPSEAHGQSDRWQVRWRDELGHQRKRNFAKRYGNDPETCAEAFAAEVKNKLDDGTSVDLAAGRTLLQKYGERWRADLLHRGSTVERMDRVFRLHIDPILGRHEVAKVRASHIRAWVKNRAEVLAPSTLAVVYGNLAAMFASAVVDRAIGISPCVGVRLPEVEHHKHFIPTPDQVHTVAATLPARQAAAAYLGAGSGLRGGEIFGLELDGVDFLRREIDVRQQLVCVTGRAPYLGPPKTKTSARTVEMPEVTALALSRLIEEYPPVEIEIDDETNPRKPVRRKAKLLLVTNRLNPMHRATWAHIWAPARDAAGIPSGIGLHCLRHYFATLLIHKGADVVTVQMALGHASPVITLNEYAGEWPEAHEKTRTIVDAALGRVPRMCPPAAVAR